ncbi:effector-associated domain 2-containing protein [Streptomyces aureoverticillatus]|uniref:effector-associated domain 2-containing protein n=1 Tax=Streptomyces aureoverticillatus TaxID=66871 RepID=UPI0013D9EC95|nr:caspase family protein [Streptomyces aureoverticillatus]QIB48233.1 caspase family protein [Streptomyces aureoverticillatus]
MRDLLRTAHAVVVGVERYAGGSAWNLDGPVRDALAYARRLLDAGLPPERLTLLASPLPANSAVVERAGLDHRPADRESVHRTLFRELPARSGEVFFLSWSGHGLVDPSGRRRLLYADAVPEDIRCLDLDAALAAWRSDLVPSFPRQLWLIDACQVFADPAGVSGALRPDPVPVGTLRERAGQYALFACAPGQTAREGGSGGTGPFTSQVLRFMDGFLGGAVDGHGSADGPSAVDKERFASGWPTDPQVFAEALRQRMRAAGDTGDTCQTPTYFWHSGPDGQSERWFRRSSETPPTPLNLTPIGSGALARPSREQRRRLLETLGRVPAMADPDTRSTVIRQLPPDMAGSVPRSAVTRFALLDLIDTCLSFPGGLDELIEALDMVDGGTSARAEFAAAVREVAGPA